MKQGRRQRKREPRDRRFRGRKEKLRNRGQKEKAKGRAGRDLAPVYEQGKSRRHTHIDDHKPEHWGLSA